jgi:hypothetical protein
MSSSAPPRPGSSTTSGTCPTRTSGSTGYLLFIGFAAVAVLSFKCVPDFLGVRGACAIVLIGAAPFLTPPTWSTTTPQRLFMVSFVYVAIALAIWLGAQPWRLRDFLGWLFARPARSRGLGPSSWPTASCSAGSAFTLR